MAGDEAAFRADLLRKLHEVASRCGGQKPGAEGLPTGFQQVGDVIVLLQPVRVVADENDDALLTMLRRLAEKNFLTGTQAVGEGGVWAAMVCGCAGHRRGFHAELSETEGATAAEALLGERSGRALVSARPKAHVPLANFVERGGRFTAEAIARVTAGDLRVRWMGETVLEIASLEALSR